MKSRTAVLLVLGTAAVVLGTLFVLQQMQPVVLRGVVVPKAARNARTVLTLRAKDAPQTVLARVSPDKQGCFEMPLQDVQSASELMLEAKRGRTRAVISPVGPHSATEFVVTLDKSGKRSQMMLGQADADARQSHPGCFGP